MLNLGKRVVEEREAKREQLEWMRSRALVDMGTGEVLSNENGAEGLEGFTRSWYSAFGARKNVRLVSRRASKALHHPADVKRHRPKLLSLTFAEVLDSWEIKGALSKFANSLMHWARRHGAECPAFFWVDEVQNETKREAAHYHMLVLGFPYIPKKVLERLWQHGWSDVRAIDDVGRSLSYLKKYMWKWADCDVNVETLPDWWFYYSIFRKRRFGFSRWFQFEPLERIPSWLCAILKEKGLESYLVGASRMDGGGWCCLIRGSPICEDDIELKMRSPLKVIKTR